MGHVRALRSSRAAPFMPGAAASDGTASAEAAERFRRAMERAAADERERKAMARSAARDEA